MVTLIKMYLTKRIIVISVYFISVNVFGIFVHFLEYMDLFFCNDCKEGDSSDVFDYIIVGGGSAGSVVARRLAEDKNLQILIVEAGKHDNTLLDIPSVGLLLQKTSFDWQYETTPQSTACFALNNNVSRWPMGRIVGGTSMLNNMIYVRGHPRDFKDWFKDKEDYNYITDVLHYFSRSENSRKGDGTSNSIYADLTFTSLLPDIILDAARSLGFHISEDTTKSIQGFGLPKVNIHKGQRWTTAHNLLSLNPNIVVRTNRHVQEILFHHNFEAYGIKYSYLDQSFYAKARKGVVLSAGVIGTPKLLLLSGIGPKEHLEEINITNKINLPVGENLQDHITTGFDLILLNQTLGIGIEEMLSPYSVFEYFWNGRGPWTTGGCESLGFMDTKSAMSAQDGSKQPDLQFMVMPLGINEDNGIHLRRLMGVSDYTWDNYFALLNQTKAMTVLPVLLHPKSRGTLRLKDDDFRSKPVINPKYLSDQSDVEVLIKGIKVVQKLTLTSSMQKIGAKFNKNVFPGCEKFKFDSKPYWECYVRRLTMTSYHPVGTCKMADENDSSGVVNFDFQVKGTNNLYVVDGSVIPTLPSGNVNGAILMLAEMASDIIKLREFINRGTCSVRELFLSKGFC